MSVPTGQEEVSLRGDKLRDLISLVYLYEKYQSGAPSVAELRRATGLSQGGKDWAIRYSGYFEEHGGKIFLSDKGHEYVRRRLLPYYSAFNPLSYLLILLGCLFLVQWYLRIYAQIIIVFEWYSGLALVIGGLILRFSLPRIHFWMIKLLKKDAVRPRQKLKDDKKLQ